MGNPYDHKAIAGIVYNVRDRHEAIAWFYSKQVECAKVLAGIATYAPAEVLVMAPKPRFFLRADPVAS